MFTKQYIVENNKHLLFLLPGQSLSPRAFWDFKLPENKTHSEYFFDAGIDVILFDPVGYGKSTNFYPYDRIEFAKQIKLVTDKITKNYETKTILGFSSTTAPSLIAAEQGFFNKVIIHSPCVRDNTRYFIKHQYEFSSNIEKLKLERIKKISDRLIPKSNKLDGWEEAVIEVIGDTKWKVPARVVYDINNYWAYNKNNGFDPNKTPPLLVIKGEYDFEMVGEGYESFKRLYPSFIEKIVENSTHFSMWENNCSSTREYIINFIKG